MSTNLQNCVLCQPEGFNARSLHALRNNDSNILPSSKHRPRTPPRGSFSMGSRRSSPSSDRHAPPLKRHETSPKRNADAKQRARAFLSDPFVCQMTTSSTEENKFEDGFKSPRNPPSEASPEEKDKARAGMAPGWTWRGPPPPHMDEVSPLRVHVNGSCCPWFQNVRDYL
jgi:hypothetical protein